MTLVNSTTHLTEITGLGANTQYSKAKKTQDIKEDALIFAKDSIKEYEGEGVILNENDPPTKNKKIDYAEVTSEEFKFDFDNYDLDGKKGLSDKEVASYIMALDGITFKFDATYLGWDFVEGADIEEDDLKKGEFSEDNIDGKIDENIQKALDSMDNDELKEIAQNIYDENFYKEPWYKKIFG